MLHIRAFLVFGVFVFWIGLIGLASTGNQVAKAILFIFGIMTGMSITVWFCYFIASLFPDPR